MDFYFVVVGKTDPQCKVFKLSKDSRDTGMQQVTSAIKIYKTCLEKNDWTIPTTNAVLDQEEVEEV
jgi:hypothetical protein